jgi:hypothetical protein
MNMNSNIQKRVTMIVAFLTLLSMTVFNPVAAVPMTTSVVLTEFEGGLAEATLLFNESALNDSLAIELPRGATINSAEVSLEGVPTMKNTYANFDFENNTVGANLWAKYDNDVTKYPPAFDPYGVAWAKPGGGEIDDMKKSDDVYWDVHGPAVTGLPVPQEYPVQLFHFSPGTSTDSYEVIWEGYGSCQGSPTNRFSAEMWLYDHTAQDWDKVKSYSRQGAGDALLRYSFDDTSKYLSSDMAIAVAIFGPHADVRGRPPIFDAGHLYTDYIGIAIGSGTTQEIPEDVSFAVDGNEVLSLEGPLSGKVSVGSTDGLADIIQAVIDSYEVIPGNVSIAFIVTVSSKTLGRINMTDLRVEYDPLVNMPPEWQGIDEVSVDEDSDWTSVLQLETAFTDDYNSGHLDYELVSNSDTANLSARLTLGAAPERYLEVKPEPNYFGDVELVLRATDLFDASTDSPLITVTVVNVADKPILIDPGQFTVNEGETVEHTMVVDDIDLPDDVLSFSDTSDWIDIDPDTGHFSWTPDQSQVGSHSFGVSVVDRFGYSSNLLITILVENINDPPKIVSELSAEATQDQEETYLILAEDPDMSIGDSLAFFAIGTTLDVTCDIETGLVTFTPGNEHVPVASITLRVVDQDGEMAEEELQVNIVNVNDGPVLIPFSPEDLDQGDTFGYQLVFDDPDLHIDLPPSAIEELTVGYSGNDAFAPDGSGLITFVATQELVGIHQVTYIVTDVGGLADSIDVTWVILNVNDVPEIITNIPDPALATEEVEFTLVLEANDIDGDAIQWSDDTTLFDIHRTTGVIEFLPDQTDVGSHQVTLTASDGMGGETSVTFLLVVQNVNDVPVIGSVLPKDGTTFKLGEEIIFLAIATDEDGDTLTYSWFNGNKVIGTGSTLGTKDLPEGDRNIRLTVSDGTDEAEHEFMVTVEDEGGVKGPYTMILVLVLILALVVSNAYFIVKRGQTALPQEDGTGVDIGDGTVELDDLEGDGRSSEEEVTEGG